MWLKLAQIILKIYLVVGEIAVLCLSAKFSKDWLDEFSLLRFLLIFVVGNAVLFLSASIYGLFVETVGYIRSIDKNVQELTRPWVRDGYAKAGNASDAGYTKPGMVSNSKMNLSDISNPEFVGKWRCVSCDTVNEGHAVMCKGCGLHR